MTSWYSISPCGSGRRRTTIGCISPELADRVDELVQRLLVEDRTRLLRVGLDLRRPQLAVDRSDVRGDRLDRGSRRTGHRPRPDDDIGGSGPSDGRQGTRRLRLRKARWG